MIESHIKGFLNDRIIWSSEAIPSLKIPSILFLINDLQRCLVYPVKLLILFQQSSQSTQKSMNRSSLTIRRQK